MEARDFSRVRLHKLTDCLIEDISDYARDGRLTESSEGKRYEWRKMIKIIKQLSKPRTDEEAENLRIK